MSYLNIVLKGRLASFMVLRHNNLVVLRLIRLFCFRLVVSNPLTWISGACLPFMINRF